MRYTTNYNLNVPEDSDKPDINPIGENMDTIDTELAKKIEVGDLPIIANNLTETVAGKALDATQGKIINDDLVAHKADYASKHITESGSNANGSYIKFDDGTMICWHQISRENVSMDAEYGSLFRESTNSSWTYPSMFNSDPSVNVRGNLFASMSYLNSLNSSSVTFRFARQTSSTESVVAYLFAIGRWK